MTVPMKCGPVYFTLIYFCYMFLFSFWSYFFSPASIISPSTIFLLYLCQCCVIWECESVWKFDTCSTHPPIIWPYIHSLVYVQTSLPVQQGLAKCIALLIPLVCHPNCSFTTPAVLTYTVFPVDTGTLLWLWDPEYKSITILQNWHFVTSQQTWILVALPWEPQISYGWHPVVFGRSKLEIQRVAVLI